MSNSVINYSLLWEKIKESAKRLGREGVRHALLMYFVLKSPDTPRSDPYLFGHCLSGIASRSDTFEPSTYYWLAG